jgi:tetratricopeptide (TPR) repeat protein
VTFRSQTRPLWTAIALIPVLFLAIAALQQRIDAKTRTIGHEQEELLLRSGQAARNLSLGYDSLLADIYWTRAVQYYGARVGVPGADFDLLWPLLDITTTLDPHLKPAYRFGAVFLAETGRGGAGRPDLAIELVKRGIAANPGEWRLDADLGFLYYWRVQDYKNAAAAYLEASKNPEAPLWAKYMAARIAQKGGSIETSRMIWSELYESTKDQNIKKVAAQQLESLKAQDDEEHLDELTEAYRTRFGHYPASIQDIITAHMLAGTPVDPAGFPYVIGPEGKTRLNPASPIVIKQLGSTPAH